MNLTLKFGAVALAIALITASSSLAIVGGEIVQDPSAVPTISIVTLKHPNSKKSKMTVCSGIIIAQDVVITKPSCVDNPKHAMVVETTHLDGRQFADFSKIRVKQMKVISVVQEPGFSYHEIAVLHLEKSLPDTYHPVAVLNTAHFDAIPGGVTLSGFGVSHANKDTINEPKQLHQAWVPNAFASMLDVSGPALTIDSASQGISFGDDGGPAVVRVGDRDYVWGMIVAKGDDKKSFRSLIMALYPFSNQIDEAIRTFYAH